MSLDSFKKDSTDNNSNSKNTKQSDDNRYKDESWLREKYNEGLSQKEISNISGVSRQTIIKYFKKYNIDTTKRDYTNEELLKILSNNPEITTQNLDDPSNNHPSKWVYENRFDSISRAKELAGLDEHTNQCPNCDKRYKKLGRHWKEACGYPKLTEYKKELLIGHMLGDATLSRNSSNTPYVSWGMSNLSFMQWLNGELGYMCRGVTFSLSAEELAQRDKESGFNKVAKADNYSDHYYAFTPTHKSLSNLDWIVDGKKQFPDGLELTPTILKMWYCGDGGLHWNEERSQGTCRITTVNEKHRLDKIESLFSDIDIKVGTTGKTVWLNQKETKKMLNYIGEAPEGMEYKWQIESYDKYKEMKDNK